MTAIGKGGSTCQGAWISSLPGADLAQNTHPTINTKLSASRLHLFCRRLCKVPTPGVYIHIRRRLFAHTLQIRRWPAPSCSPSLRRPPHLRNCNHPLLRRYRVLDEHARQRQRQQQRRRRFPATRPSAATSHPWQEYGPSRHAGRGLHQPAADTSGQPK